MKNIPAKLMLFMGMHLGLGLILIFVGLVGVFSMMGNHLKYVSLSGYVEILLLGFASLVSLLLVYRKFSWGRFSTPLIFTYLSVISFIRQGEGRVALAAIYLLFVCISWRFLNKNRLNLKYYKGTYTS